MSNDRNVLEMSDEEFLNNVPEPDGTPIERPETVIETPAAPTEAELAAEKEVEEAAEKTAETETNAEAEGAKTGEGEAAAAAKTEAGATTTDTQATSTTEAVTDKPADTGSSDAEAEKAKAAEVKPDAAKVFSVPSSFQANGKTIELKTEAEALSLMQMGANYTRKMQELAPHRRVLTMLQNNNLLDESKLSFLIDLDKKNPEAVKKLIKDAGLDPLEIDTSADSNYVAGDHTVSDDEVKFRTVIDELASTSAGTETLQVINTQWDSASKEILWTTPEVATAIHEQRENGAYALIAAEVNRRRTIGLVPVNMPFLQAYTEIGKEMAEAALATENQGQEQQKTVATPTAAEPLATRVATPKSPVANSDKAGAASPTKATSSTAAVKTNPLAMSDEEFIKINSLNV